LKLSNLRVLREIEMHDARILVTRESRKKNRDRKIRRKEWPKCGRKKREKEKRTADRSTGIRAPRALPGEDVQRLCPRARRIRVTGICFPPAFRPPRGLPCFILVYHPVTRSLPRRLPRKPPSPFSFLPFSSLQFQSKPSCVGRTRKENQHRCNLWVRRFHNQNCLQLCLERSAGANDDREKVWKTKISDVKWLRILLFFNRNAFSSWLISRYKGCSIKGCRLGGYSSKLR